MSLEDNSKYHPHDFSSYYELLANSKPPVDNGNDNDSGCLIQGCAFLFVALAFFFLTAGCYISMLTIQLILGGLG